MNDTPDIEKRALDWLDAKSDGGDIFPYSIVNGAIHLTKRSRDGDTTMPLCNFTARIREHVIHDDGATELGVFVIEGAVSNRCLKQIEVALGKFHALTWVTSEWGNTPIVYAGHTNRDHLRCAIQILSGEVETRTVYAHTGWRKLDRQWLYLHGGGALGDDGQRDDIEVQLGEGHMRNYALPDPPSGDDLVHAVRESLAMTRITSNPSIGHALLAATYRAPLGEIHYMDAALFITGKTGEKKSEISAIPLAHFGDTFDARSFPACYDDTATDLEIKCHAAKDAVFVIDDFKPKGGAGETAALYAKADRVFRGIGNRSGRGRRRPNLEARPTYYPRGVVISSGEDVPRGASLRARLLILDTKPGDVDVMVLTRLQRAAGDGELARAMAGYIQWIAPRIDQLKTTLPDAARVYRKQNLGFSHARHADTYGQFVVGLEQFFEFSVDVGAISRSEADLYLKSGKAALAEGLKTQRAYLDDADEVSKFLSLLNAALSSGEAHLANRETGGQPNKPGGWGWRQKSLSLVPEWEPLGRRIGWIDDTYMYLEGESAFAAVQRMASAQNDSLGVSKGVLWRRLNDAKLLVETDKTRDRLAVRKSINGTRRSVYMLDVSKIDIYIAENVPTVPTVPPMGSEATDGAASRISGEGNFPSHMGRFNRPTTAHLKKVWDGFDGEWDGRKTQPSPNFPEFSNNNNCDINEIESVGDEWDERDPDFDIYMQRVFGRADENKLICCKNCRFCRSAETDRGIVCEAGVDVDSKMTKWTRWYCDSFERC